MKKLIIFGNGQIAELANFYFTNDSEYEVVAFTADSAYINEPLFNGLPLISFERIEIDYPNDQYDMFIALSYSKMNSNREVKFNAAKQKGYKLASYVSTNCNYLTKFQCGENCFILEDNTIQPFVKIGNNVILWSGNHIGHHSSIEDNTFISSHVVVSGNCIIGRNSFLGVNATLHNEVHLGEKNLIGAGAIITSSTKENQVFLPPKSTLFSKTSIELNF